MIDLRQCVHLRVVNLHAPGFTSPELDATTFHRAYFPFMVQHLPPFVQRLRLGLFYGGYDIGVNVGLSRMPWSDIFKALPRSPPIPSLDICLMSDSEGVRLARWSDQMKAHVDEWLEHLPSKSTVKPPYTSLNSDIRWYAAELLS